MSVRAVPLQEACERADVTYRQGYTWLNNGLLHGRWYSSGGDYLGSAPTGSGSRCLLAPEEVKVLMLGGKLVRAGLVPKVALPAARQLGKCRRGQVELAPGVILKLGEERGA